MTQKQRILDTFKDGGSYTIKALKDKLNILEPNIRRILGVGAKKGTFQRVGKGVYTLKTLNDKQVAWVECGKAEEVLPRLVKDGNKFDMIFLDPAYYTKALIGGNRKLVNYKFMYPREFGIAVQSVVNLVRNEDSHIYLMLAGCKTGQDDMKKYSDMMLKHGLKLVEEGYYQKLFKNGKKVTNPQGKVANPERVLLFTKSGKARAGEKTTKLEFTYERPSRKGYKTEKAPELLRDLILNSTHKNESVLDCFAGSGVTGDEALKLNRKIGLIEISQKTIDNYIKPRIK